MITTLFDMWACRHVAMRCNGQPDSQALRILEGNNHVRHETLFFGIMIKIS
jgi:hypothetical protein